MPKAAGYWRLRSATVARSAEVRAWKIISIFGAAERVARAASARGPLPKKMTWWVGETVRGCLGWKGLACLGWTGLVFIGKEVGVRLDVAVVVSGLEVAVLIHTEESLGLVFDVVDEEDAFEVVNFVEEGAGEVIFGSQADFGAVFEEGFDLDFLGAGNEAVEFGNGEAAFVVGLGFAVGFDDFGVDEGGEGVFGFVLEVVADDDNALVDAELGGGHGGRELVGVLFFPL